MSTFNQVVLLALHDNASSSTHRIDAVIITIPSRLASIAVVFDTIDPSGIDRNWRATIRIDTPSLESYLHLSLLIGAKCTVRRRYLTPSFAALVVENFSEPFLDLFLMLLHRVQC